MMHAKKLSIHIMQHMGRSRKGYYIMEERIYKIMGGSGALNIVIGVVSLVAGITGGVLLIISGAKLLSGKSKILF